MLTELEKKVLASIQDDIPITERPYYEMAVNAGISEETFLKTMQNLVDRHVTDDSGRQSGIKNPVLKPMP